MDDNEFEKIRVDILNFLADLELSKANKDTINYIPEKISKLNQIIFSLNDEKIDKNDISNFQTLEYYHLIDCCLQYYRIRDLYASLIGM